MKTPEIVDVLVDLTSYDVNTLKELMSRIESIYYMVFESEQGHQVNITFRKDPDE